MAIIKEFLKLIFLVILLIILPRFLGCSSTRQTNSQNIQIENKPINSTAGSSFDENNSNTIPEESFIKEWKNKFEAASSELERNRNLWQENKIDSYDFVIANSAGGNTNEWNRSPVLIKVRNNEKTSIEVESKSDKSIMARTVGFEDFDTIDKLFDYMRRELNDTKIINVKYDKRFGYPKSVFMKFTNTIDHNYQTIQISKFETVK